MKMKLFTFLLFLCAGHFAMAQNAPDFTITAAGGSVHHLYSDYLDQGKVVMIELMFVNCPPCNAVAEQVQTKYAAWGGGAENVQFISLSIKSNDSNADVAGYESLHGITFPGAGADGGALSAVAPYKDGTFGNFWGTPTFIVVSPDRSVDYGLDLSEIDMSIQNALAGGAYDVSVHGYIRTLDLENGLAGSIISAPAYGTKDTVDSFGFYTMQLHGTGEIPDSVELTLSHLDESPVAGVSAGDIVFIQKVILNILGFTHPLQLYSADVNASGQLTAADIVEIRKLILGKKQNFSGGRQMYNYQVQNMPVSPVNRGWTQIDANNQGNLNFVGIKMGDLK